MIFHPQNLIHTDGKLIIEGNMNAIAHPCLNKGIIKDFWYGFTFHSSTLNISECEGFLFTIGAAKPLSLDGCDYSINVESDGLCVCANNEKDLVRGFMTLLDRFKAVDCNGELAIEIDCCQIKDKPLIQNRMVHFCVFPKTELWEIQKFIRFAAALKYTHLILEFWGMFRFDCLQELSWNNAFHKEELRPLLDEGRTLGLEIVPMFNHWGHASASRVSRGKHVVLDQNPTLQYLFSENGWCWNIRSPRVRALQREIRRELIELCGEGQYFHIGCDEAYGFDISRQENAVLMCDFINELSADLTAQGRRAIMWGDMLLYKHPHYNSDNEYVCNCPTADAEQYMLTHLSRDIIIADWQYDAPEAPVETAFVFHEEGFDTMLCPWDRSVPKLNSCLSTVKNEHLYGLIHTTWNTLSKGMPYVMLAAVGSFEKTEGIRASHFAPNAASLVRKVYFVDGDHEKAGWSNFRAD